MRPDRRRDRLASSRMPTTSRPWRSRSYRHIFSPNVVGDFRGMVRNNGNDFYSNDLSTPIILFQHNWFNEGYFKGMVTDRSRPQRVESRSGIGQHLSARKFQLQHHRPIAVRSRHGAHLQLSRSLSESGPASGPGAVGVCAGPDSPGQLDDESGPALGPLPAGRQQAGGRSARGHLALFPRARIDRALFVRPRLSDAVVRESSACHFVRSRVHQS